MLKDVIYKNVLYVAIKSLMHNNVDYFFNLTMINFQSIVILRGDVTHYIIANTNSVQYMHF